MKTIKTLVDCKNKIAISKGYDNWDTYYNWVARDGQLPAVVAQLIESAIQEAFEEYVSQFPVSDEKKECWEKGAKQDYENGYESETSAIDKFIESVDELPHGVKLCNCPECGAEIQYGLSKETIEAFNNSKLFKPNQVSDKAVPAETIGSIITDAINLFEFEPSFLGKKIGLTEGTVRKLMNNEIYTNNVPVRLFCNLVLVLHIPISKIESAMLHTFRLLVSKETPESIKKKPVHYQLWENEESVIKYLTRLKEIYEQ